MGAPAANKNAMTHGVRGFLSLGSYPRGSAYIRRQLGSLCKNIETVILERDGEISIYSAALIQSCCRHEGRAQLLQRWLRVSEEKSPLKLLDRMSVLKEIGAASDSRDRCLKLLDLDKQGNSDPWAALDSPSNGLADTEPQNGRVTHSADSAPQQSSEHVNTSHGATEKPLNETTNSSQPQPEGT